MTFNSCLSIKYNLFAERDARNLKLMEEYGFNIRQFAVQTEEMCLAAVRSQPMSLQYVRVKTPKVIEEAVKQNGLAIQFVKPEQQTYNLMTYAIQNNPMALSYMYDVSITLYDFAEIVCDNPLKYIILQKPEICEYAIRKDPKNIRFIRKQTEELCMLALSLDNEVWKYIRNPTDAIGVFAAFQKPSFLDRLNN